MDAQWDFCSAKTPTFELRVLLDSRNLQPVLGSRINEKWTWPKSWLPGVKCKRPGCRCFTISFWWKCNNVLLKSSLQSRYEMTTLKNSLQCVAGNVLITPASVGGTYLSNQHDVQNREINFPNVQPSLRAASKLGLDFSWDVWRLHIGSA